MINSLNLNQLGLLSLGSIFIPIKGNKQPLEPAWQKSGYSLDELKQKFKNNIEFKAVGVLTGNSLLSIDVDGLAAFAKAQELSGLDDPFPPTVMFTSRLRIEGDDKPEKFQALYRVPPDWEIKNKPINCAAEGKTEQLDFRYSGRQSVILGQHPETGAYRFVEGCSPDLVAIADCPLWVKEYFDSLQIVPSIKHSTARLNIDYLLCSPSAVPPLEYFLSKSNQAALNGLPKGGRFTGLQALAADLIGCSNELDANGTNYSGNAEDLFLQACLNSGSNDRKSLAIFPAFLKKPCSPAITSEGIEKRLHWYRWNNDPEYQANSKREYAKQFKATTNDYLGSHTDSFNNSNSDLDSYVDCDIPIDDIPEMSKKDYGHHLQIEQQEKLSLSVTSSNLYFPNVSLEQWQLIATNNNLLLPDWVTIESDFNQDVTNEFWQWVQNNDVTVLLTVGETIASDFIQLGYCSVGFSNVYSGVTTPRNDLGEIIGKPQLSAELKPFTITPREFTICFGSPKSYKALDRRFKATTQLAYILSQNNSVVTVIENFKADLTSFVNNPALLDFADILHARIDVERLKYNWRTDITKLPDVIKVQDERYFSIKGYEERIAESNLILLVGNQGTGKTEVINQITTTLKKQGFIPFATTHRVQLGLALSGRLGIPYVDEAKGGGDIACIDSRHPKGRAYIDYRYFKQEVLFIYDEIEQVLNHAFSSTTCKEERAGILKELETGISSLISKGGKIILADANLTPKTVNYFEQLAGEKLKKVIFWNDYQPKKESTVHYFKSPDFWVNELDRQIAEGKKIYTFTDGQKIKSLKGTTNLGTYLQKKYPLLKILIADRDTVADPNHEAYGITTRLDDLRKYDVVLASSVLETGISIIFKDENEETLKHFDSVFTISSGGLPADTVIQGSTRVRGQVDIYLFAASTSRVRLEGGSTNPNQIIKYMNQKTDNHIKQLNKLADEYTGQNPHLDWYIENCAKQNYENKHYREIILEGYERLGYTLKLFTNEAIEKMNENKEHLEKLRGTFKEMIGKKMIQLAPLDSKLRSLEDTLKLPVIEDELLVAKEELAAAEERAGISAKREEKTELERAKEGTKKIIASLAKELKNLECELGIEAKIGELAATSKLKERKDLIREIEFRLNNNAQYSQLLEKIKGLKIYSSYLTNTIKSLLSEINFRTLNNTVIQSLLNNVKDLSRELDFRRNNNFNLTNILKGINEINRACSPNIQDLSGQIKEISGDYEEMIAQSQIIKKELKVNSEINYEAHLEQVMQAEDISPDHYKLLQKKKELTKPERHSLKKATAKDLFMQEPSKQLITYLDDKVYPKWQLHYYLSAGYNQLFDRDLHKLEALSYDGLTPFQPDVNSSLLSGKVKVLKDINIELLLNPDTKFNQTFLTDWVDNAAPHLPTFNNLFGTAISSKAKPVVIAQSVLNALELKLQAVSRKKNRRTYQLVGLDDGRFSTFEQWLIKGDDKDKGITREAWLKRVATSKVLQFSSPCQTFPIYRDESLADPSENPKNGESLAPSLKSLAGFEKEEEPDLRTDTVGELLAKVGFSQAKQKISNLTDQFRRSALYMKLIECFTGRHSWSYVGDTHYIVSLSESEQHLTINSFAPGAPGTFRINELLRE